MSQRAATARLTTSPRTPRPLLISALVVLTWATLAAWVGYQAVDPAWARDSLLVPSGAPAAAGETVGLGTIIATNLSAALLLYSGVATAGLTTLLAATWTGAYVGATLAVTVENVGLGPLLARVWIYLPLELGAMLGAAIAGAYPLLATLLGSPAREGAARAPSAPQRYLRATRTSMLLLGVSAGVLLAAALIEATLIG